jgi:hypothetical protein
LLELFALTEKFFGASKNVTDYLYREAQNLSRELVSVEGFVGTFGLGYPFYALTPEGVPVHAAEIYNFIELTRQKINEDARMNPEGWNCLACQLVNYLPDLKSKCKPCDLVALKPRDVFKGLPDLDMVIVVDNPNATTEQAVEAITNRMGYLQADTNIAQAINRTKSVLHDLISGKEPSQKLPVDIHIWSREAFEQCMEQVASGIDSVTIIGRSLHMNWENNPINFWFDFVFSLTEINMQDPEFQKKIAAARKRLKDTVGVEKIVQMVEATSPRAASLLRTQAIHDILVARLTSW